MSRPRKKAAATHGALPAPAEIEKLWHDTRLPPVSAAIIDGVTLCLSHYAPSSDFMEREKRKAKARAVAKVLLDECRHDYVENGLPHVKLTVNLALVKLERALRVAEPLFHAARGREREWLIGALAVWDYVGTLLDQHTHSADASLVKFTAAALSRLGYRAATANAVSKAIREHRASFGRPHVKRTGAIDTLQCP